MPSYKFQEGLDEAKKDQQANYFSIRWNNKRNEKSDQRNKGNESGGWILKECLLCNKELKTGEHFTDLIFINQQEEWICKECKEDFEQIGEIHCPRCFKDKEEKVCKDCEYWKTKGNMFNMKLYIDIMEQ